MTVEYLQSRLLDADWERSQSGTSRNMEGAYNLNSQPSHPLRSVSLSLFYTHISSLPLLPPLLLSYSLTFLLSIPCLLLSPLFAFSDLSSNGINGSLPSSIGNFSKLYSLDLTNNSISGSIPESIGLLTYLDTLDLAGNNLTGSLPASMSLLTNLHAM
ncbi:unnamed protein product [Closterium sp. NIES-54]